MNIRRPYTIFEESDSRIPMFHCALCGERIKDISNVMLAGPVAGTEQNWTDAVLLHKSTCLDAYESERGPCGTFEFADALIWMSANSLIDAPRSSLIYFRQNLEQLIKSIDSAVAERNPDEASGHS